MANGQMHDPFQLDPASSLGEQVGRAADPERRERRQRDIGLDALVAEQAAQLRGQRGEARRFRP